MAEDKAPSKFHKKCPECNQWINSKGWLNHIRKHGINPEESQKNASLVDLSLEQVLREEAQKILKEHPEIVQEEARKLVRERWGEVKDRITGKSGGESDEPGRNKAA